MAETPEDRGPDSARRVEYDPTNPIHEGIMRTPEVNAHIDRPAARDAKKFITMPVKRGMESTPTLSSKYGELIKNKPYELPEEHRIDIKSEAKKLDKELKAKKFEQVASAAREKRNPKAKSSEKPAAPVKKPTKKPVGKKYWEGSTSSGMSPEAKKAWMEKNGLA